MADITDEGIRGALSSRASMTSLINIEKAMREAMTIIHRH